MQHLTDLYFIGKVKDKHFIFRQMAGKGGLMVFGSDGESFHTVEDAHLWLIEKAKEDSSDNIKYSCVEVEKEYLFLRGESAGNNDK